MHFKIADTKADLDEFIRVLHEQSTLNQLEIVDNGIRDRCEHMLTLSQTSVPTLIPGVAYNDDGDCMGINMIKLGETVPCWYQRFAFASTLCRNTLGVTKLQFGAMRWGFNYAESRNYHEYYYVQRSARNRLLQKYFQSADFLKKYIIEDVEVIQPYNHSVNPYIRTYIHGPASGLFPREMLVKRFYNPEFVNYAYPYPQSN